MLEMEEDDLWEAEELEEMAARRSGSGGSGATRAAAAAAAAWRTAALAVKMEKNPWPGQGVAAEAYSGDDGWTPSLAFREQPLEMEETPFFLK